MKTAYHRRAAKSMENGKIQPSADPKPLNQSTQNLKQMITSARRPHVRNFMQIRPLEASRQMGEI